MLSSFIDHLQRQPLWVTLPTYLGFLLLSKHSLSFLTWLIVTFLKPPKDLLTAYGSWAVVTGATDGIGKAFAFQLAAKGLNLILISRSQAKLETVSLEIQAQFPNTQIKTVALDLSAADDDAAFSGAMEEALGGAEVGVLVNNAGTTYPAARYFDEVEERVWRREVVGVNVKGTTWVTAAVLAGMVKRRRGAVVNIGSGSALVIPSHPLFAIYSASKA